MGAGASTLSPETKACISREIKNKYEDYTHNHNQISTEDEIQLYETLKSVYEKSLTGTVSSSVEPTPSSPDVKKKDKESANISVPLDNEPHAVQPVLTPPRTSFRSPKALSDKSPSQQFTKGAARQGSFEDEGESYEFSLRHSFAVMKDDDQVSELTSISRIEGPSKLLRAKTSAQLLSMVNEEVLSDQEKISSFINLLKAGDVQYKAPTEFRQRRLTYSQQTVSEPPATMQSPKPAPKPPKSRTTIFASSEIGVVQEKKPPFPHEVLGTYSCHGIEPSEDEEDGIHEKINQDRGCIVYPYNSRRDEALFMVLDGHGEQGDKVSEFVMRQIVVSLEKDPLLDTDPVKALKNAYITTNTALLVTDIRYETSGCTCVTIYCKGNKLYVANVGDSRAVMAYTDSTAETGLSAKNLTRDHKPDDPDEKARIEAWGGYVCPPHEEGLSARVYLEPEFRSIGLAMSRSIGDHAVKHVGVIPEPEIKIFDVQPEDQFMIMASDGVWEFISSQEAVEIVQSCMEEGVPEACQELIEVAASRWQEEEGDYRDDITAIVVKFPLPFRTTEESVKEATTPVKE